MSYYRQGPHRPGGSGSTFGVPQMTPYIKLIMIVCGAVWLIQATLLATGFDLSYYLGVRPSWVIRGALYQPLTYMFLHDPTSPWHLLINMVMIWMFGSELERYWGSKGFLRYYLVCGVGAGIAAALVGLLRGDVDIPTIGASGALFGLFVAYGIVFAERTVLVMLIIPMKARTMALIMFGLTFFYTLKSPYDGVSHIAHLGGAVVGFLYLKRAWRWGALYREIKWKIRRRRLRVMRPNDHDDSDRWIN